MKEFLRLPLALYFTLVFCLVLLTVIWDRTEDNSYKELINYLGAFFCCSTLIGAFLIRRGLFEKWRNILNVIWNVETACAFIYATYLAVAYSIASIKTPEIVVEWARENNVLFTIAIVFLGSIVIMRAGFSLAELFKESILIKKKREEEVSTELLKE